MRVRKKSKRTSPKAKRKKTRPSGKGKNQRKITKRIVKPPAAEPKTVPAPSPQTPPQPAPIPVIDPSPVLTLDRIREDTSIGDVLLAYPRTREVFAKYGLKLDLENAGDMYLTIGAFAAYHRLEAKQIIKEVNEIKDQPQTPPQTQVMVAPVPGVR